jgi:hypothetical protein
MVKHVLGSREKKKTWKIQDLFCNPLLYIWTIMIFTSATGHSVAYWLRHYAARRKIVGSRPDEESEFF